MESAPWHAMLCLRRVYKRDSKETQKRIQRELSASSGYDAQAGKDGQLKPSGRFRTPLKDGWGTRGTGDGRGLVKIQSKFCLTCKRNASRAVLMNPSKCTKRFQKFAVYTIVYTGDIMVVKVFMRVSSSPQFKSGVLFTYRH